MTVVLDTNVIVAALVAKGLCHEVVVRCLRGHEVAASAPLLDELERTLRDKFVLTPEACAFVKRFRAHVRLVDPEPLPVPVCRDRDDDLVLATAAEARADVIVTGDADLIVLESYRDTRILTPRQFLEAASGSR